MSGIPQTSIDQYQGVPLAGTPADSNYAVRHYIVDKTDVAQVSQGTMVNANAGTYSAVINGVIITVTYATSVANTLALLVAAINAQAYIKDLVIAAVTSSTTYTVTARTAGVPFTQTSSTTGASNTLTIAEVTANVTAEYLTPGRLVVQDTQTTSSAIKRCKRPAASTDMDAAIEIVGIVMRQAQGHDPAQTDDDKYYAPKTVVPVIHRGVVWVEVEEAVTPASAVFARYASGAGGTKLGAFRTDADTSTAGAVAGAKYLTAASAGGRAKLAVNFL